MTRPGGGLRGLLTIVAVLALCALPTPLAAQVKFRAILIGGDTSLPVFDNATAALRTALQERGVTEIQRIHTSRATVRTVLKSIAALHPGPGEGCLVFATSHGGKGAGLYLSRSDDFLTPPALDAALTQSCGDRPTVAILSACYSGLFTQTPMTRPNRIILTAARPDRPSFGCGAGRRYTVYDACLLDHIRVAPTWPALHRSIQDCVAREETAEQEQPSEPQLFVGAAVPNLPLPGPP